MWREGTINRAPFDHALPLSSRNETLLAAEATVWQYISQCRTLSVTQTHSEGHIWMENILSTIGSNCCQLNLLEAESAFKSFIFSHCGPMKMFCFLPRRQGSNLLTWFVWTPCKRFVSGLEYMRSLGTGLLGLLQTSTVLRTHSILLTREDRIWPLGLLSIRLLPRTVNCQLTWLLPHMIQTHTSELP